MAVDPQKNLLLVQDFISNHSGKKIKKNVHFRDGNIVKKASSAFENYFEIIHSGVED